MINPEIVEFCEDNSISIKKFLRDNFELERVFPKFNKRNKKWKIKHSEIAGWCNVVPVSLLFAYRYKELVLIGKILIVEDECGKYNAYINPRIIAETYGLAELEAELKELDSTSECLDIFENMQKRAALARKVQSIQENVRLIKHFKGDESLEYTHRVFATLGEVERIGTTRKRVEKN